MNAPAKRFLRRAEAAEYTKTHYGFGTKKTLEKLASIGGGPEFRKVGRLVLYEPDAIDRWALARMSAPMRSTSDAA